MGLPKIISLFSGAGGLDLGFKEAGYEVVFASDMSPWAMATHKRNFPSTFSLTADLVELGPTGLLESLSNHVLPGQAIGIIGGPPCQGFSRANTSADPSDPRNLLPILYLDVVELLQIHYDVKFVLFENVLGIRDKKHSVSFAGILARLSDLGLSEQVTEYCAVDYGVPQTRKRVIISAFDDERARALFSPKTVDGPVKTVRDAIESLPEPAFYSRTLTVDDIPHHPNHWTMRPVSKRFSNPGAWRDGTRSFRKLKWDYPSPTVAYGHREIHVHPSGERRLSIYEAMILQGFPDDFILEGSLSAQVEQVSNAVPPPLAYAIAEGVRDALESVHIEGARSAI